MGSYEEGTFTVPTIDLSEYLRQPNSECAEDVIEQIRNACATSGFFQLVGHNVPGALQQEAFAAAKAFFSLSDADKHKLRGKPGRGYEVIGTQFLEPGKQADLKEGFFVGHEIAGLESSTLPFREPNVWPHEEQIPGSQFKEPLLKYHGALLQLSLIIMRVLATGMKGFDTTVFADFCHEPIASLRLLHYPPHPDSDDETLVGTGAHTDFGAITLLLQDDKSGLQVLNQASNKWFDVVPQKGAYVVNVGDMLDVWTGGAYKSTVHRVINKSGGDRYSIPFFLDGNPDCTIRPLAEETGPWKIKPFTVQEHMMSRYAASYT
ncbi:hypothetical protein M409DRAFT_20719 [Zasmidium cellare ATCC 36951]|uniref:Fe2OG dioxygenase domain-containing protein n=1 Tax=Zasmidium cellare ATCC 36951 TaxID=1080233 RepID=A0A6A6CSA1_ZASCE|nr:uncharacterized protein M409DRAFT_20719 [Zasmidium cellare ATCC 36951]KAF2168702.1 hypothetical protein M409DRAFT_20719 [Zasmidium cellare ATCC 36951]